MDSVSVGTTTSLQHSDNIRHTAEIQTVMQANETNEQKQKPTLKQVETAVDKLNDFVEPLRTNLKFELHEELNEYYVTIVNPNTNEVIKEIPSKKILDMYAAMGEYMGFLIDKKI
ncbi:flagellar protein FlaG [Ornithinibacillus scapharcae]|uniref:flagellar protein FlaG n=1 Tax=Ornithinibacillus scapharcae TaxID=1147159 RepID=UPI001872A89E|nr:flagellar protein FlaG [Ornithinibacillus scapharcae]